MQEPTHILTGVLIQKSLAGIKPRSVALGLTATLAFLSHGVLDELARVTYHPPNADFHSVFWVSFHSLVLAATIFFLWRWWRKYKWGIFFAALPDLDWVFIHGQDLFHVKIPCYRHPLMHDLLHNIYHGIPPFTWITSLIERLPNNRQHPQPWACLWEILLVAVLLLTLRLMTMAERPSAKSHEPA